MHRPACISFTVAGHTKFVPDWEFAESAAEPLHREARVSNRGADCAREFHRHGTNGNTGDSSPLAHACGFTLDSVRNLTFFSCLMIETIEFFFESIIKQ